MSLSVLPLRYVRVTKHGMFKYRRGIPAALQSTAGRREIVLSLNTKDPHEAEIRALKVHGDAEVWLKALASIKEPARRAITVAGELSSLDEWYRGTALLENLGVTSLFSPTAFVRVAKNGVFKYRRGITTALQPSAGRSEIVWSLNTRDPHEAALRALKVHAEVEAWLKALTSTQEPERLAITIAHELSSVDEWYRGTALLESLGVPALRGRAPHEQAARGHLTSGTRCGNDRVPRVDVRALMRARQKTDPTLQEALEVYLCERQERTEAMLPLERRSWIMDKERTVRDLRDALGEEFTLSSLSRHHVRTFAVYLKARGLKPSSVARSIRIAGAIVEVSLGEFGINIRNPFHAFTVRDPVAARRKRLPLTHDELRTVLELPVNRELRAIVTVLALTGARLREVTGLTWADVRDLDSNQPFLDLRPNEVRDLKTPWSARAVPLLAQAAAILREHRSQSPTSPVLRDGAAPVFPRYGRDGGSAAASRALTRALRRNGITDRRKSSHSLRHTVKQRLRDVGVPKDIRDAVQGHGARDIADTYGLGIALTVMRDALEKAFQGFGGVRS